MLRQYYTRGGERKVTTLKHNHHVRDGWYPAPGIQKQQDQHAEPIRLQYYHVGKSVWATQASAYQTIM